MRILVVEDETKMADYLRKALTESGYSVEIALDGLDGQHLVQESEFDLIILDVMLPGLDGWQLLQIIRRKWQTPVLFLLALGGSFVSFIYSAPPLKLKQNGWLGNYALGASYIALPWWAGQALFGKLSWATAALLFLEPPPYVSLK